MEHLSSVSPSLADQKNRKLGEKSAAEATIDEAETSSGASELLSHLSATFDQKMKFLLDPNPQNSTSNLNFRAESSDSGIASENQSQQQPRKKQLDEAWNLNLKQAKQSQMVGFRQPDLLTGTGRVKKQVNEGWQQQRQQRQQRQWERRRKMQW